MKKITDNCTGCGLCSFICPKNAVRIIENDLGENIAHIDTSQCVACGLCSRSCPEINLVEKQSPQKCYGAWALDKSIYNSTTSGGIATIITKKVLSMNGVVYGSTCLPDASVNHIRVTDHESLNLIKGSKYVQSNIVKCYALIEKDLQEDRTVLFIGTPCQVAAIKRAFGRYKKLITIDLICHGTPPVRYFIEHIKYLGFSREKISVKFRDKRYWLSIYVDGERKYRKRFTHDPYFLGFMNGLLIRENCCNCKYSCIDRCGDLTLGDFWGISKLQSKTERPTFVSCVFVNSMIGEWLFNEVNSECGYEEHSIEEATKENPNIIIPSQRHKKRDAFNTHYRKFGYVGAIERSFIPWCIIGNIIRDALAVPYRFMKYGASYKELL